MILHEQNRNGRVGPYFIYTTVWPLPPLLTDKRVISAAERMPSLLRLLEIRQRDYEASEFSRAPTTLFSGPFITETAAAALAREVSVVSRKIPVLKARRGSHRQSIRE